MLATGRIYACLPNEAFVMNKLDPIHVGVMVIYAMVGQGAQIMSMKIVASYKNTF